MEFDDVTQTGELPLDDEPAFDAPAPRRDPLPWALLAIIAVASVVAVSLLWVRVSREVARADEAEVARVTAEANAAAALERATAAEAKQAEAEQRLAERPPRPEVTADASPPAAVEAQPPHPAVKKKAPSSRAKKKAKKRRRRR